MVTGVKPFCCFSISLINSACLLPNIYAHIIITQQCVLLHAQKNMSHTDNRFLKKGATSSNSLYLYGSLDGVGKQSWMCKKRLLVPGAIWLKNSNRVIETEEEIKMCVGTISTIKELFIKSTKQEWSEDYPLWHSTHSQSWWRNNTETQRFLTDNSKTMHVQLHIYPPHF